MSTTPPNVDHTNAESPVTTAHSQPTPLWGTTGQAPRRIPWARLASTGLLTALALFALIGPLIWRQYTSQDLSQFLQPPSLAEPFGHDHLGRSVIARLAHATRLSLGLAIVCVATAATTGVALGLLAAWRRGWVDQMLLGISEIFLALPALLIVLIFAALASGEMWTIYIGIALALWVEYFRVVRARSVSVLTSPAIEAANLLRLGPAHMLRRHLWPELAPVLLTMASLGMATAVLAMSTLSYVGVGLKPPTAELGLLITESLPYYHEAPWMVTAPIVVLLLLLAGLLGLRAQEVRR
ncbi:ABC transporter permease [Arthrobacter sp. H41]|uniref:ABC transporter permease n=1 Tax=Arthrobacter sp. H41 TaxID=1312978 RepID=UPI0004B4C72B|nr:ABC transporter permease [Arthrobacter sp. H41]